MGERRRTTMGGRGAQPDPIRNISYGLPEQPQRDSGTAVRARLKKYIRPKRCSCGIELPVIGNCDYCE